MTYRIKVIECIIKLFTHNRCDTCGFTKDDVYVSELYMEAGLIQCNKCIEKSKSCNIESK